MPPTRELIHSARPTVQVEGREVERVSQLLAGMVMHELEGGMSSLELRLLNIASTSSGGAEVAFDAGGDLRLGAVITVGGGEATSPTEIFRGAITGLEGNFRSGEPPELTVLAEDALHQARRKRRSRVFEDLTLGDIVRQIAGEHGLTPQITGLSENFGTQVQMNETDLGFLRRLLVRVDADLQVVGAELQVSPRGQVRRGEVELVWGRELREARVLADLAHQVTENTVKGWDARNGSALSANGSEQALGPGQGTRGGQAQQSAFGERSHHTGHLALFNDAEARAVADTVRHGRARRFLVIHAVAEGNPALRVGTHARVSGLGQWFSNTFYVVETRHTFDLEKGYRTEFRGECAFLEPAA